MPGKKQPLRIVTRAPQKESGTDRSVVSQPPTVSPRWLLTAIAITVLAAMAATTTRASGLEKARRLV